MTMDATTMDARMKAPSIIRWTPATDSFWLDLSMCFRSVETSILGLRILWASEQSMAAWGEEVHALFSDHGWDVTAETNGTAWIVPPPDGGDSTRTIPGYLCCTTGPTSYYRRAVDDAPAPAPAPAPAAPTLTAINTLLDQRKNTLSVYIQRLRTLQSQWCLTQCPERREYLERRMNITRQQCLDLLTIQAGDL